MDQSVQSGLRLAGSWPVAHSLECPLESESVLLPGSWQVAHSIECPVESWTTQTRTAQVVASYSNPQTQPRLLEMAGVQSTTRPQPSAAPQHW
eukprot:6455729-Amphidinium_carterae.1